MKKILFILFILTLLTACGHKVDPEYADIEPMLVIWQTTISSHKLEAKNIGLIEYDSTKIRALVEELRIQAQANDTIKVSCLMLSDAAQDTVVQMYGIK